MSSRTVDRRVQGDEVERHLAAAVEYLTIAESGDAERSAYEHAAIEIEAAMQLDPTLTQRKVGARIGKGKDYVGRLLAALSRGRDTGEPFRIDWARGSHSTRAEFDRVVAERPERVVEAFRQAPPEARQAIAREISRAPEIRAEARRRDVEAEERRRPEAVTPRVDHTLYEFESRLVGARRYLREALALVDGIDQPGDDEDLVELLEMLKQLADAVAEAYRTGKSLDTWAWELYERSAD